MKKIGLLILLTFIALCAVLGCLRTLEAVLVFMLAGLIPGTNFSIAPLLVIGYSSIIAGAFWLPSIVEHILFPTRKINRDLPKNRYRKLTI